MKTRRRNTFTTIRTEGAILPPDLLQRISEGAANLDGLQPTDYHLLAGEKLNEAVNRSWNRLIGAWENFKTAQEKVIAGQPGTTETRQRWLLPLFQELGYGRLQTSTAFNLDGKSYPISHGWGKAPIHLLGFNIDLGKRTPGVAGAATTSPHSMVQEFLNRSDEHLWAFLSNGLQLRVLRDNVSLTRQAYVEFDLQAMMEGEVYADFVLLWLLCHQSRVEGEKPDGFWLESWSRQAQDQGTRALDQLRAGVEEAISSLGSGFLGAAANQELRAKLRQGALSPQDYYRQLLRLVYRLIFLFVAEDRDLLFPPDSDLIAQQRYRDYYSTQRMRRLAERSRGLRHADLYHVLRLVTAQLSSVAGCPELALPALGGFLFSAEATPDLDAAELPNQHLLDAVRALAYTVDGRTLRPVDYKNLGPEELGSVYESLLELHPEMNVEAGSFSLTSASGHERKTTGSYYTPSSLIQVLLDSALDPVIADRLKAAGATSENQGAALLDIQVCDPACGSGHFLIAAAHRLARHLAAIRTGDDEPSPEATRAALRDVISHCLYGVDLNPMAVELCKVGLWMEALEPGKPLSFLDAHIKCGNSLVGVGPGLDIAEIPDNAFRPAFGDDKSTATALRRRNKREREGQLGFRWDVTQIKDQQDLAQWVARQSQKLEAMPEESAAQIREKEAAYHTLLTTDHYQSQRLEYDLWTAAFFWPIPEGDAETMLAPSQQELLHLRKGEDLDAELTRRVQAIAKQHRFFHWEFEFPIIYREKNPGFDIVLGNPPWVRQELLKDLKKFFSIYHSYKSTADLSVLFLELSINITNKIGFSSLLTPNKWFKSSYAENLRKILRENCQVEFLIDFGHSRNLFPDADTFPAAVILQPTGIRADDDAILRFLKAHDADRKRESLKALIENETIFLPHKQLLTSAWHLEHQDIFTLLNKLLEAGKPLASYIQENIYSGIKSGFNEAFYIDSKTREAIIESYPDAIGLIKPFLRGRDMSRWTCEWENRWHIVIPSSQNKSWPWSEISDEQKAEVIFEKTYPTIYNHLKNYKKRLKKRSDKGDFWWELRSCDYYEVFSQPKTLVQCIAYDSQFLIDADGYYINNSSLLIPSGDLYLLAVLNSRIMWWIMNRTFQHMKDGAVSMEIHYLENVPIPTASNRIKLQIVELAEELIYARSVQDHEKELILDTKLSFLVARAYGLSESESQLIAMSLPLRDPLERQASRLNKIIASRDNGNQDAQNLVIDVWNRMKKSFDLKSKSAPLTDPPPADPSVAHPMRDGSRYEGSGLVIEEQSAVGREQKAVRDEPEEYKDVEDVEEEPIPEDEAVAEEKAVEVDEAPALATDWGMYKCVDCGQIVLGFGKDEHIRKIHKGKDVGWERLK